jgi:DNA polymerase III gamma/tau subunit
MIMDDQFTKKYRPSDFSEYFGNEIMIKSLQNVLPTQKTHLFYGEKGCGKTTLARICAKYIGCHNRYIKEYDTSVMGLKDSARKLNRECGIIPHKGNMAFILDEPQDSSSGFQGAMLKILEEPPAKVWWFLCTTNPEKLRDTILSRATQHKVEPLDKKTGISFLKKICEKEKKKIDLEVLRKIWYSCDGIPRDMLKNLEKIIDLGTKEEQLGSITNIITEDSRQIKELIGLFNKNDWNTLNNIINGLEDQQPETLRRAVLGCINAFYCRNNGDQLYFDIAEEFVNNFYDSGFMGFRLACRRVWLLNQEYI